MIPQDKALSADTHDTPESVAALTDDDCPLCGGAGELNARTERGDNEVVGCPACIQREADADQRAQAAEIARLKEALDAEDDTVRRELAVRTDECIEALARATQAEAKLREWSTAACYGCGCGGEHTPAEFQGQWEAVLARASKAESALVAYVDLAGDLIDATGTTSLPDAVKAAVLAVEQGQAMREAIAAAITGSRQVRSGSVSCARAAALAKIERALEGSPPLSDLIGERPAQETVPADAETFEDRTGVSPICPACGNDQHDDWWHCLSGNEHLLCGNLECACGAVFSITSRTPGRWMSHLPHGPADAREGGHAA